MLDCVSFYPLYLLFFSFSRQKGGTQKLGSSKGYLLSYQTPIPTSWSLSIHFTILSLNILLKLIFFKSQGRWTCAGHDRVGLVMSRSKVCVRPRSQVKLSRHVGYWSRVTGRPSDMNLYPIQALCRDLLSRTELSLVHSLKTHQGSHEIREVL